MLKGKKIILGITGSIAAYKAAYLLRLFKKEEAEVQILITPSGKEFITPATLYALSGRPVLGTFFETNDGTWHSHVDLGLWADVMIIAPATANTLAKMAMGICDNLLLTTYLSVRCPIFIAPAMDSDMFLHPASQNNISLLKERGCTVIEPGTGVLASGLHGKGRMEEPEVIVEKLKDFFKNNEKKKTLEGMRVLVTAGPTFENIDPVRYIGNYSSGKTGFAIAEELAARGAFVELIAGPVNQNIDNKLINRTNVISADNMYKASLEKFPKCNAAILTAAVSDFKPAHYSSQKIKRENNNLIVELKENKDIAAKLGSIKKPNQILVGFALETEKAELNAVKKLKEKNLDFIILNSLSKQNKCFGEDDNKITIIDNENKKQEFPFKCKKEIAIDIVNELENNFDKLKCPF